MAMSALPSPVITLTHTMLSICNYMYRDHTQHGMQGFGSVSMGKSSEELTWQHLAAKAPPAFSQCISILSNFQESSRTHIETVEI